MLLQGTLNGPFSKRDHSAVPITTMELARDATACATAGAKAFHLHPRDATGRESLAPEVVDSVVAAVKAACGLPVGVSTGAWIVPDLRDRVKLIQRWRAPDYATVNLSEEGSEQVMRALQTGGVGIEAGVWTVDDVDRLADSAFADQVLRICVEPVELPADGAVEFVDRIHERLDELELRAPRLQHGDGPCCWILLDDAYRRGLATRIGLEDTFLRPDGRVTAGNPELVIIAARRSAATVLQ